jgi:hypothetical protein
MNSRLLGAALATVWLTVTPRAAWAQHSGHGRAHATPPASSTSSHASAARGFHAPPYYLFRRERARGGLFAGYPTGYPCYYFSPGGYLDPFPRSLWWAYPNRSAPSYAYDPSLTDSYGSAFVNGLAMPPYVPAPESTAVPPMSTGGMSFAITPEEAAIFVDGAYVGTASDFFARALPFSLTAGRHQFELRAPGYETATFDIDVIPGRITLYQRQLTPAQPSRRRSPLK